MTRGRPDLLTTVLAMFGLVCIATVLVPVRDADAADPVPIELSSTWTDALSLLETNWFDLFGEASMPVAIDNVLATGDFFAKRNLLEGDDGGKQIGLDFIVSGTRLTAEELETANGVAYLQIPVSVASAAIPVREPNGGWVTKVPGSTETEDGEIIENPALPYAGPIRLRPTVLFDLFRSSVVLPRDARFIEDSGVPIYYERFGLSATDPISRVDPGALPAALRRYFEATVPTELDAFLKGAKVDLSLLGPEDWPFLFGATRSNNASLRTALAGALSPGNAAIGGGLVGVMDTTNASTLTADFPSIDFRLAQLQNAAKQWVAPTKAALTAGVTAGIRSGDPATTFVENAALRDASVTGGYPLTWLNWLIVPASTLTPAKANAVATVVRFLVLDGQKDIDAAGSPALPNALVASALASADTLVTQSCPASTHRVVTRTDAGPYAPASFKLPTGRTISFCEAVPVATTTTAAPTTTAKATTTTAAPTTSSSSTTTTAAPETTPVPVQVGGVTATRTGGGSTSPPSTVPPTTTAAPPPTTTAAPPPTTTAPPVEAVTFPLDPPVHTRPAFDRFSTMAMGGASFFGAARRYRRTGSR